MEHFLDERRRVLKIIQIFSSKLSYQSLLMDSLLIGNVPKYAPAKFHFMFCQKICLQ